MGPVVWVAVGLAHQILAVDVSLVVGQQHERVMVQQLIQQGLKQLPITLGKMARGNQINGVLEQGG